MLGALCYINTHAQSVNVFEAIFETFHCMRAALPCCRPSRSMVTRAPSSAVAGRVDVDQHRYAAPPVRLLWDHTEVGMSLSSCRRPFYHGDPKDPRMLVNHGLDCRWISPTLLYNEHIFKVLLYIDQCIVYNMFAMMR